MAPADISIQEHTSIPCNLVLIGFMGTGKSTVSDYFHTQYNMDSTSATLRPLFSSKCSPAKAWSSPAAEAFPCASATSRK